MGKLERKNHLQSLLLYMTATLLIFSCTGIKKRQDSVVLSQSTNQPPVTILLDTMPPAKRVDLKSAPSPRIIQVPQNGVGFYTLHTEKGEEKIQLGPPVVIKALPPIANFTNFNTEEGLALSGIFCGLPDKKGRLWFGTNGGGISCHDGARFTNFSLEQGLSYVTVGCMMEDKRGNLWFGTHGGSEALTVFIRSIKIDETNINWYSLEQNRKDSTLIAQQEAIVYGKSLPVKLRDSLQEKFKDIQFDSITAFYQLPENLLLPYKDNRVSFDFGAIETSRNFMVRYQYILEGYDKEWNPVTEKSSASFGNIKEGSYTFKLKVRSPEGIWSDPINYSFKVLPPWWRTWWMYVTYIIISLTVLWTFIKGRERSLRKEKDQLERKVETRTHELNEEKNRSENLLLNILPAETAEELKRTGMAHAKDFNEVTVLFTDFKNFTKMTEQLNARELVSEINYCYSAFDNIISKYGVEKIKTIGDSYMCAGGLPVENETNPEDTLMAALEIRDFMVREKQKRETLGKSFFEIRIGLHTGPVVAGIVGIKKFAYDIWSDTVNIASRMESSGESGKVNISGSTYELVKEKFKCAYRGKIEAKNKGEIDMYFVEA
jgi:class 3 adenylate cyclase